MVVNCTPKTGAHGKWPLRRTTTSMRLLRSRTARPPGRTHTAGTAEHERHAGHDRHAGHSVAMFRDRFWITLLLTIPTLVWSDMIKGGCDSARHRSPDLRIPAVFGTAVYLYGGWVFLVGGLRELRDRLPGMMTLISLAISVAFFFSLP